MVIANQTKSQTMRSIAPRLLSAVLAGGPKEQDSAELREVIEAAQERRKLYFKRTILFVKQVHLGNPYPPQEENHYERSPFSRPHP